MKHGLLPPALLLGIGICILLLPKARASNEFASPPAEFEGYINNHPDGEELKDKKINTVSFSGGGAMMTYAVSRSSHKTSISRVGYNDQFRHVTSSEINVGVMAVSSSAKVSLGAQDYLRNSETQQEHTDEQSSTVTFHFGDPDIGDYFDVAVYEDPYFPGGFIFHTTSGRSKCPHEPNTVQREVPGISVQKSPAAKVAPHTPAIYVLALTNDAQSEEASDYEFFLDMASNQDGLKVYINGQAFTAPIAFTDLAYGSKQIIVEVERGPYLFEYPPLIFGLRSQCDPNLAATEAVEVAFLTPCSQAQFSGALELIGSFTVNRDTALNGNGKGEQKNELAIDAFNPNYITRPWAQDSRLEYIKLLYRKVGGYTWLTALKVVNNSAVPLDFNSTEGPYGYSRQYWYVGNIDDGDYEIQLQSKCRSSSLNDFAGIDGSNSMILTGKIDREAPYAFSEFSEPADGEYEPGDEISVTFNEEVAFSERVIHVWCSGRKIAFEFPAAVTFEDLQHAVQVHMSVSNVRDLANNVLQRPVSWSFGVAKYDPSTVQVTIDYLYAVVQGHAEILTQSFATQEAIMQDLLLQDLSDLLDISKTRLEFTQAWLWLPGELAFSLRILAASDRKAESAVTVQQRLMEFISQGNGTSSFKGIVTNKLAKTKVHVDFQGADKQALVPPMALCAPSIVSTESTGSTTTPETSGVTGASETTASTDAETAPGSQDGSSANTQATTTPISATSASVSQTNSAAAPATSTTSPSDGDGNSNNDDSSNSAASAGSGDTCALNNGSDDRIWHICILCVQTLVLVLAMAYFMRKKTRRHGKTKIDPERDVMQILRELSADMNEAGIAGRRVMNPLYVPPPSPHAADHSAYVDVDAAGVSDEPQ